MDFQDECQTCGVWLTLAAPEHQEMNGKVEVTWRTLRTITHSLMIHERVLEVYIHLTLMYMEYHILLVLPIKDLINEYGETTVPFKIATGTKPLILHLSVFFCPFVVLKYTSHAGKKALNMHYQTQKVF